MLVIPAVDIKDGKVVRLYQGDFSKESRYSQDPLEAALMWQGLGAGLIHVVDLNGALEGVPRNLDWLIKIIKKSTVDVEVGGGLRDLGIINELLQAGAARVVLGSKAFSDYSFLDNFKSKISERIAISIDVKFIKIQRKGDNINDILIDVANFGWLKSQALSLKGALNEFYKKGIRFINFTNIQRDGTMSGADIDSIKAVCACTEDFRDLNLIASGGISSISDIEKLKKVKALYGVIIGKALYEGKIDFKEAKQTAEIQN